MTLNVPELNVHRHVIINSLHIHKLSIYNETCLIRHLCKPFNGVLRSELLFPCDHAGGAVS